MVLHPVSKKGKSLIKVVSSVKLNSTVDKKGDILEYLPQTAVKLYLYRSSLSTESWGLDLLDLVSLSDLSRMKNRFTYSKLVTWSKVQSCTLKFLKFQKEVSNCFESFKNITMS